MVEGRYKTITCFFIINNLTYSYPIIVDDNITNGVADAILNLILKHNLKLYNLSFIIDNDNVTYKAEYLISMCDFHTRKHLLNGNFS